MSRSDSKKRPLIAYQNPKSAASEAYRSLRTNIQFSSADQVIRTIMITSAGPGEGKSTTASNLATTYAQADQKVLLIDADLRKPTVHHTFMISNRYGLTNVLTNQCRHREVIVESYIPNLYVMPSGGHAPNPAELLASNRMRNLIEELREEFETIVIDTPPSLAVADAQIVSSLCDGVLLVIDSGKVKISQAQKVKEKLAHVNAKVLGVVLNNLKRNGEEGYYYYYYYGDND